MAKIILMAASTRKDSLNKKLALNAHRILAAQFAQHQVELLSMNDFVMPVYDGDLEAQSGVPAAVQSLGNKILEADAIVISTPEYNGSIPGTFKNAIDWVSRLKPMPWGGKKLLLLSASPGAFGGIRGLWHTRVPLEALGVFVFPEMFALPSAHTLFDESGKLKDAGTEERLRLLLGKFQQQI